jgi:hypothetical protein
MKSNKKIGDFYVYSIDELYDTIIKMSEETVNFMRNNCNNPVSQLKETIEVRITIVNSLLIIFNETMDKLLEIIKELNRNPDTFLVKEEIEKQKDSKIITYIKLRCDNEYNQRFQVFVNKNKKELVIGHNPYLGGDLGNTNDIVNNSQSNQYLYDGYGVFDEVFLPTEKNIDISKKIVRLKDTLNAGKSVCLIAYGASGAGKTSTLLYFRGVPGEKEPENGIIPNLCNSLDQKYNKITITAKELRADYKDTVKNYWQNFDVLHKPAIFNRVGSEWITNETSYNVINYPKLHNSAICESPEPFENLRKEQKVFGSNLGDFIASLIDIRLNCGTTNNPDSSRTHMLVFIKFNDNGPTLVVADLAGVEKPFDCDSLVVLENFARNKVYYKNINAELSKIITGGALNSIFQEIKEGTNISVEKLKNEILFSYRNEKNDKLFIKVLTLFIDPDLIFNKLKGSIYNDYLESLELFCKYIDNKGYLKILKEKILEGKITTIKEQDLDNVTKIIKTIATYNDVNDKTNFYGKMTQSSPNIEAYQKKLSKIFTGRTDGYSTTKDILTKSKIGLVIDELIKLENYFNVLREKTTGICRTRTTEGYFISRSLGELRNLIRVFAASSSIGPSFIVACYEIICPSYFDSTECLPKYETKLPDNFMSSILKTMKDGGITNIDDLTYCVFNVCNLTNNKNTDPIRQIYSPLGDLLGPSLESIKKVETLRRKIIEKMMIIPQNSYSEQISYIYQKLEILKELKNQFLDLFMSYKKEMEQVDLTKRPSESKQRKYFEDSKLIWDNIKTITKEITKAILEKENNYYKLSLLNDFTLLENIKKDITKIIKEEEEENATTMIGTMSFIEEVAKLGRREMKCYVENGLEHFRLNSDNYIHLN